MRYFFFPILNFHSFLSASNFFVRISSPLIRAKSTIQKDLSLGKQSISSCPYLLLPPLFANRLNPLKSSICINTLVREFKRKLKFNLINDSKQKEKCFFLKQIDSFFFFRVLIYSKCKKKILEYTQIIQGSITFSRILIYKERVSTNLTNFPEKNNRREFFILEKSNFYLVIQQCLQHFKVICDTMETNYESSTLLKGW